MFLKRFFMIYLPSIEGRLTCLPPTCAGEVSARGRIVLGLLVTQFLPSETQAQEASLSPAADLVQTGGPVVVILLTMSILATAVVLLKFWQFYRSGAVQRKIGRQGIELLKEGKTKEALFLVREAKSPVPQALARAIRGIERGLPEDKVREEVLRFGGNVLEELRSGFRILEVIATLAPLLGLLGTVIGMIEAFRELELAGNQVNPALLSGGIWKALLTTAVGLSVAIPVVAVLNWLERIVESLAHELDSVITRVFTEDLSQDPAREKLSDAGDHAQAAG